MALVKLQIWVEAGPNVFVPAIMAMFNPNTLAIHKTANWTTVPKAERDTPSSQFTHGDAATLTVDLIFDTFATGEDVRLYTEGLVYLTTIERNGELHRPPICRLVWGRGVFFQGVVQDLNQTFSLFLADGTPVRAKLACTFRQWRSDGEEWRLLGLLSADVAKSRVVRPGDTLSSIAGEEYRDPAMWRPIAEANRIDDPLSIVPGQLLAVPPLTRRSSP